MPTPADLQNWLQAGLPDADIRVDGDGRHFDAVIVDESFAGKSAVQRHQIIYRILGDKMREEIHALTMKTLTPDEAAS